MKHRASRALLRVFDRRMQRRYEPYLTHFRVVVGYQPSILLPEKYHEKLLWRKLIDHNPMHAIFCDKLATKDFIRERLPGWPVVPTLWCGDSLEDMPANLLGEKCMIKCNHGCAFNHVWTPGRSDFDSLKHETAQWLGTTYGTTNYEWGYRRVRPKLFAEPLLEPRGGGPLVDIKFRCCNGKAALVRVHAPDETGHKACAWFTPEGERLNFTTGFNAETPFPPDFRLPATYREALEAAQVLSRDVDYARFDFMFDGDVHHAGEITAYPAAGLSPASRSGQHGVDIYFNPHWDIRKSWFLSTPQRGWLGLYASLLRAAL